MKIVFFGTSEFAVRPLRTLYSSRHSILAVVTAQDKRKGRNLRVAFSEVKAFAQKKNLPIFQPANLQDINFLKALKNRPADLHVVCAYGKILTKEILEIPKIYAINLHASLLPKYRGAAPANWAIIKGETESGVTIFRMDERMDTGEIILQDKTDITAKDTAVTLADKLSAIGTKSLLKSLDLIEQDEVTFTAQDENQVTFAPKLKKEDGLIDWRSCALDIYNRIKGLQPWPGAFTYLGNKLLKVWQAKVIESEKEQDRQPAEITEVSRKNGILVQTGKDKLLITAVQLEGKRRMTASEFILGHRIKPGTKLRAE